MDWWYVSGVVHHSDLDSPTVCSCKYRGGSEDGPSNAQEALTKIEIHWNSKWGGYKERNIRRVENITWEWMPGG